MKKESISKIETMMQYKDELEFIEHCEKISRAISELVERKTSSYPEILYVKEVDKY